MRRQPQIAYFFDYGESSPSDDENFVDNSPTLENVLFGHEFDTIAFTDLERQYIQNKLNGYNNKEIYIRLGNISPHQLRIQVKEKLRRHYAQETKENINS